MVHADKNRLSSFGTAKGYPAIAVCARLPTPIQNGERRGKRVCVGWFSVVRILFFNHNCMQFTHRTMQLQEDSGETGKKKYVNFKRVVWHKAFYEILKSVEQYAETGYHLTTADIER